MLKPHISTCNDIEAADQVGFGLTYDCISLAMRKCDHAYVNFGSKVSCSEPLYRVNGSYTPLRVGTYSSKSHAYTRKL